MITVKKIAGLLAGVVLACSSINILADTNVVTDSTITAKVKAKMMADPAISSSNISVETTDGVVVLSGKVPTDKEVSAAIETAQSTSDVKDVDASKLSVEKSSQPIADTVITAKVKGLFTREKLFGDNPISVTGISVETKDGVVHLTGEATHAQIQTAIKLAKSVKGAKRVDAKVKANSTKK